MPWVGEARARRGGSVVRGRDNTQPRYYDVSILGLLEYLSMAHLQFTKRVDCASFPQLLTLPLTDHQREFTNGHSRSQVDP